MEKPFSRACENNRQPILDVIGPLYAGCRAVLEIGSGTGQHAVFFAAQLPHLQWHTSDLPEHHPGIIAWLADAGPGNAHPPLALDVCGDWPALDVDAAFSANTAHIMHWHMVEAMIAGVGQLLPAGGRFALYGPFSYAGHHTSDSNARFDEMLRARDPGMGVRDFDDVTRLAAAAGLELLEDRAMPANNRTLCWQKTAG